MFVMPRYSLLLGLVESLESRRPTPTEKTKKNAATPQDHPKHDVLVNSGRTSMLFV